MSGSIARVLLVCAVAFAVGCDSKAPTPPAQEPETKAPETNAPEAGPPETKAPDTKAPEAKAPEAKPDAGIEGEVDPNAKKIVTPVDFGRKPPEGAEVQGKHHYSFGWEDKHGRNAVVMGIKTTESGEEGTTSVLTADYLLWEGDAWTLQRRFKERVAACDFDTTLKAAKGKWTVTDIDGDGIGEATIAYTAGCRSDVSSVAHKVLVIRTNDKGEVEKFALRGKTRLDMGDGLVEGGKYRIGKEFDTAPKGFLEHAKKVWKKTATEKMR